MRKFLWLNPVVTEMYGSEELERRLTEKGYELAVCRNDHIAAVKEKYLSVLGKAHTCVADVRCPMAVDYIKKNYDPDFLEFPDIEPILLHCARELHGRLSGQGQLWIITPCGALSRMGNRMGLPETKFCTWKEFARMEHIPLRGKVLAESPIPPGFFDGHKEPSVVLDSRKKIDLYFSASHRREERGIMELLYCSNGCHHGDGV
ncbi:hypothetical protein AALB39_13760 [Lachnospiraceae bacterium 54-53]